MTVKAIVTITTMVCFISSNVSILNVYWGDLFKIAYYINATDEEIC